MTLRKVHSRKAKPTHRMVCPQSSPWVMLLRDREEGLMRDLQEYGAAFEPGLAYADSSKELLLEALRD